MNSNTTSAIIWSIFFICVFGGCSVEQYFDYKSETEKRNFELKLKQEETKRIGIAAGVCK